MSKSVLYEQDDRIVKITLNRPDTRNALSGDIIEGLVEYIQKADKDKNVGCVILTILSSCSYKTDFTIFHLKVFLQLS